MDLTTNFLAVPSRDLEKGIIPQESLQLSFSNQGNTGGPIDSCSQKEPSIDVRETEQRDKAKFIDKIFHRIRYIISWKPSDPLDPIFPDIVRGVERCELGYPYLASFIESSEDFMIYRRFGFLHTRLLLEKQDELVELERLLDSMDDNDKDTDELRLQRRLHDDDKPRTNVFGEGRSRKELFFEIEEAILKYDDLLLKYQAMVDSHRPTRREQKNVVYFMAHKGSKLVASGENEYIRHKEDLLTLRPGRETAWLDTMILNMVKRLPRKWMKKVFCLKQIKDKTEDPIFFLPRSSRLLKFGNSVVIGWVLIMFTVPIYALFYIGSKFEKDQKEKAEKIKGISMGILFLATGIFALGLAFFTRAKRHETLAASAAYCALLVVFIANLGTSK